MGRWGGGRSGEEGGVGRRGEREGGEREARNGPADRRRIAHIVLAVSVVPTFLSPIILP